MQDLLIPPTTATVVGGEAWLLPEGATSTTAPGAVPIGTWSGESVSEGTVIALDLSPALDAFVTGAFKGNGRFTVYAVGTAPTGQVVACTLHVVLGGKLKWKVI